MDTLFVFLRDKKNGVKYHFGDFCYIKLIRAGSGLFFIPMAGDGGWVSSHEHPSLHYIETLLSLYGAKEAQVGNDNAVTLVRVDAEAQQRGLFKQFKLPDHDT